MSKRTIAQIATKTAKVAADLALGSEKRQATSAGAALGAGAAFALPGMGLALLGTAVALWWAILILPLVLLGALIGNWLGLLRENAALRKRG